MARKDSGAKLWALFSVVALAASLLLACAQRAPTPAPASVVTKLDTSYGAVPAAGWKWGVAEITTGAEGRTEDTARHRFTWAFYVVRGSTEVGTGDANKVIPNGEATLVPAEQDHTHRFLPQSQVLVFRPADRPFGEFHRGTRLYESSSTLDLKAGQSYSIRIREFTLASKASQSITAEAAFGYVLDGTLTVGTGSAAAAYQAGKVFDLPSKGAQTLRNEGTAPLRFTLVDLHQ